jgi:hypothetical protein
MNTDANYPAMSSSELDRAPWAQKENVKKRFNVSVSSSLSKTTEVYTNDYVYSDEEIYCDTSNTNWKDAYQENHHLTPIELISKFKDLLQATLPDPVVHPKEYKKQQDLIHECENWTEDECEIFEE